MLQMVKTLAQFTIALEDMRDLGPAAASGEPTGSSADAEEPGASQVGGRRGTARDLGQGLELSRPGTRASMGRCWSAGPRTLIWRTGCLATGLGAQ